jgi:hypothetical protein
MVRRTGCVCCTCVLIGKWCKWRGVFLSLSPFRLSSSSQDGHNLSLSRSLSPSRNPHETCDCRIRDGKRVLVRVDYNVPIKDGVVQDATRIETTIPTLNHLLTKGKPKCLVLIAHLGQPAGNYDRSAYTLAPAAACLQTFLPNNPVRFLEECVGPDVEKEINSCAPGTVFLLENLRSVCLCVQLFFFHSRLTLFRLLAL